MNNTKHINKIEYHYTVIEIAGIVIKICTDLPQIKSFYQKFESNKRPVLSINVTEKDIEEENRKHNFWTYECQRKIITQKELDIETVFIDNGNKRSIENTVMCRKIAEELLNLNVFLMHGAAISLDNNTIIFTAPSGIGKTTHIQKWLDHFPDAFVVNGDKPFIKISHDNLSPPLACGSPWAGKENKYTNTMVPIKAIVCMERSEENHITEITFAQAFPFLLQQSYRPGDKDKMRKTLRLLQSLNGKVKFYRFKCNNFKDDCFEVAYNALVRNMD